MGSRLSTCTRPPIVQLIPLIAAGALKSQKASHIVQIPTAIDVFGSCDAVVRVSKNVIYLFVLAVFGNSCRWSYLTNNGLSAAL